MKYVERLKEEVMI